MDWLKGAIVAGMGTLIGSPACVITRPRPLTTRFATSWLKDRTNFLKVRQNACSYLHLHVSCHLLAVTDMKSATSATVVALLFLLGCAPSGETAASSSTAPSPSAQQQPLTAPAAKPSTPTAQAPTPTTPAPIEQVTITEQSTKFTWGDPSKPAPDSKVATVKYPEVSGVSDAALQKKIQESISLKRVFGKSLEEMRSEFQEYHWLNELSYTVNYNQNGLLDITYSAWGTAAYPDGFERYVTVNLNTGEVVYAHDLFKTEALGTLARLVNEQMQTAISKKMAEITQDNPEVDRRIFEGHQFRIKNLNRFTLSDKGITFHYEFGFPHVLKAAEPKGEYFLSYSQIKPYLKPDSPLVSLAQ